MLAADPQTRWPLILVATVAGLARVAQRAPAPSTAPSVAVDLGT